MRILVTTLSALAMAAVLALLLPRGSSAPVPAPPGRVAFLLRFGVDGKTDADWSGSIASPHTALAPWQFSEGDTLAGDSWKCTTRTETYWDTPYERKMQPTSNIDKVTIKGVLVEFEQPAAAAIQVSTKQGDFTFKPDIAPGDAPRLVLNGRASITAVAAGAPITNDPAAD